MVQLRLVLLLLVMALGRIASAEVTVYPTSYESWSWSASLLTSGVLADVQSDNNVYMVFQCNTANHNTSAAFWFDTVYTAAQLASITYDCQFSASRTDTPGYHIMVKDSTGESWRRVGGGLWTTTDQNFSWTTTEADAVMTTGGRLGLEICGCATSGNTNNYATSIDLVRVRLELHTAAPSAPTDLAATVMSQSQVRLTWTDTSTNEYRFKLERKTGASGTWSEIAQPKMDATSYYDNTVSNSTTYYYRLCAYNAIGDSAWTSEAVAVMPVPGPPNAPTSLSALAKSPTRIDLCWSDTARDEDGFIVEVDIGNTGTFIELATVERNYTRYSHTGLSEGTPYVYRIRARNSLGSSAASAPASATPHALLVVVVSDLPSLQSAIDAAAPGTIIEIEDGAYLLATNGIFLNDKSDLTIRSHSRNRNAVIIKGNGLNDWPEFCFKLYRSQHIVFEDMTLRDVYWHCVQVNEGSSDVVFRNLYMWDAGEGPIKSTLMIVDGVGQQDGPFCDNGLVENCVIGYTNGSTRGAIEGIDLMGSANWMIRYTSFYGVFGDPYYTGSPGWGFFAKGGSIDTTVDDCYFEDCGVAISFGGGGSPDEWKRYHSLAEHTGGIMRNNVVRRTSRVIPVNDVAIYMNKATDYRIYNNTFWTTSDTGSSVDIRFPESIGRAFNNIGNQPLHLRDGGAATEATNIWNADGNLFVDQPAGDFHLRVDATSAIDQGVTTDWVKMDMDGQVRPFGSAYDIGADEHVVGSFTDVSDGAWGFSEIEWCFHAGIVQGYTDGTYRPFGIVKRDQMAAYVARALAGGDAFVPTGPSVNTFSDVLADTWAYQYIEYAADNKVVQGYTDGSYKPGLAVNRSQMSAFIGRAVAEPGERPELPGYSPPAAPSFTDVPTDHWAYTFIEYCREQNIVQGYADGTYRPDLNVTRGQMAVYVARAFAPL